LIEAAPFRVQIRYDQAKHRYVYRVRQYDACLPVTYNETSQLVSTRLYNKAVKRYPVSDGWVIYINLRFHQPKLRGMYLVYCTSVDAIVPPAGGAVSETWSAKVWRQHGHLKVRTRRLGC
jgi:hypothetical protein